MVQQLIFTSAPQGLKPATRGFATVAATPDMSPPLAARLESLSAYTPAFGLSDDQYPLNPVCFSHLRFELAGKRHHLLSRVAPCGADYSGRSNILAHHVVLEPHERNAAGPAALCAAPGFLRDAWSGKPGYLSPPNVPEPDPNPATCKAWQHLTGDAGWAGFIGQSLTTSPNRPVYLVHALGVDMMPLLREAIALLTPDQRWTISFTTCFTGPVANASWQIRCVLADTPAARAIPRGNEAAVLNLNHITGAPPNNLWTQAARSGQLIQPRTSPPEVAAHAPQSAASLRPPQAQHEEGRYELAMRHEVGLTGTAFDDLDAGPDLMTPPKTRRSTWLILIFAVLLIILGIGMGVIGVLFWTDAPPPPALDAMAADHQTTAPPPDNPRSDTTPPDPPEIEIAPPQPPPPADKEPPHEQPLLQVMTPKDPAPPDEVVPVKPSPRASTFNLTAPKFDDLDRFSDRKFNFQAIGLTTDRPAQINQTPRFYFHIDRINNHTTAAELRWIPPNMIAVDKTESFDSKQLGTLALTFTGTGEAISMQWAPEDDLNNKDLEQMRIGLSAKESTGVMHVLYFKSACKIEPLEVTSRLPTVTLTPPPAFQHISADDKLSPPDATIKSENGRSFLQLTTQYPRLMKKWQRLIKGDPKANPSIPSWKALQSRVTRLKNTPLPDKKEHKTALEDGEKKRRQRFDELTQTREAMAREDQRIAGIIGTDAHIDFVDAYNVPVLRYVLKFRKSDLPPLPACCE